MRITFVFFVCAASALWSVTVEPDNDYDLTLDSGEEMRKITVALADADWVTIEMKGLAERLRIPRPAIKSARLIVKKKFFRRWEVGLYGDFNLALSDLALLAKIFPSGSLAVTGHLTNRMRYTLIDAIAAEVNYMYITDGERQIHGGGFVLSPRWHFMVAKTKWVVGVGGGITGLYLKSFNFTRLSQAGTFFAEFGAIQDIGKRIHLYGLIRTSYWTDSQALLQSLGVRIGVGYSW